MCEHMKYYKLTFPSFCRSTASLLFFLFYFVRYMKRAELNFILCYRVASMAYGNRANHCDYIVNIYLELSMTADGYYYYLIVLHCCCLGWQPGLCCNTHTHTHMCYLIVNRRKKNKHGVLNGV